MVRDLRPRTRLGAIIGGGLAVPLALVPLYAHLPNHSTDEGFWKTWMLAIHEHGVLNVFRTTETDYVGYQWLLWACATIYSMIGRPYTATTPSLHVLVKMPPILFDMLLIVTVFVATRSLDARSAAADKGARAATVAAAIIAFHPAVIYDSAAWAQVDAAVTAAMLGALVLTASGRPAAGWSLWALGLAVRRRLRPSFSVGVEPLVVLGSRRPPPS